MALSRHEPSLPTPDKHEYVLGDEVECAPRRNGKPHTHLATFFHDRAGVRCLFLPEKGYSGPLCNYRVTRVWRGEALVASVLVPYGEPSAQKPVPPTRGPRKRNPVLVRDPRRAPRVGDILVLRGMRHVVIESPHKDYVACSVGPGAPSYTKHSSWWGKMKSAEVSK